MVEPPLCALGFLERLEETGSRSTSTTSIGQRPCLSRCPLWTAYRYYLGKSAAGVNCHLRQSMTWHEQERPSQLSRPLRRSSDRHT